jgi:hypothetical protein
MSSSTNRVDARQHGIYVASPGSKIINCVVHDCGSGILPVEEAIGAEVYGCIVYNNGYQGAEPDRGHGHAMYVQNYEGTKLIRGNVCFNNFGWGLHIYGVEGRGVGITMDGNVLFNSGSISREGSNPNILVEPNEPADRISIINNFCYNSSVLTKNLDLGSTSVTYGSLTLTSNYLAKGFSEIKYWTNATIRGNFFKNSRQSLWWEDTKALPSYTWDYNAIICGNLYQTLTNAVNIEWDDWKALTGFDAHSTIAFANPYTVDIYTWANAYDANRVHVVAFSWPGAETVSVNLSGLVSFGSNYSVRTVQNYYGSAIASGTYAGGSITLPTSGLTVAAPVGLSAPSESGPTFNSYVIDVIPAALTGKRIKQAKIRGARL